MYIRLATPQDYGYISHALARKNIEYIKPSHAKIDIQNNRLYLIVDDNNTIIAQCALVEETAHNYTAIKRLLIYRKENCGKGIANIFLSYFVSLNCPIGATPWTENEKTKHLLRKYGFEYQYTFLEKYEFFLKKPLTNS